jgi:diadenosine tetraphosphatase ApaH/serine/threonine PP2A family protein phosphatase
VTATVRYLILSDIHANHDALDAVFDAAGGAWDRLLVLGDLVGYGAEPNEVVARVRALDPIAVIRGNHDKAACGLEDGENFNQVARFAAAWTRQQLTPDNRAYLRALPPGPVTIDERLEICHGAPFDEDHYIFDGSDAQRAFGTASRPVCVFGHTHLPVIFKVVANQFEVEVPEGAHLVQPLEAGSRYLLNPGSVGQPRDGDPRAGFGIYTTDGTFTFRRIDYDVSAAQRRISAAGLPQGLANRLAIGR